jgi:hypothetical protein
MADEICWWNDSRYRIFQRQENFAVVSVPLPGQENVGVLRMLPANHYSEVPTLDNTLPYVDENRGLTGLFYDGTTPKVNPVHEILAELSPVEQIEAELSGWSGVFSVFRSHLAGINRDIERFRRDSRL